MPTSGVPESARKRKTKNHPALRVASWVFCGLISYAALSVYQWRFGLSQAALLGLLAVLAMVLIPAGVDIFQRTTSHENGVKETTWERYLISNDVKVSLAFTSFVGSSVALFFISDAVNAVSRIITYVALGVYLVGVLIILNFSWKIYHWSYFPDNPTKDEYSYRSRKLIEFIKRDKTPKTTVRMWEQIWGGEVDVTEINQVDLFGAYEKDCSQYLSHFGNKDLPSSLWNVIIQNLDKNPFISSLGFQDMVFKASFGGLMYRWLSGEEAEEKTGIDSSALKKLFDSLVALELKDGCSGIEHMLTEVDSYAKSLADKDRYRVIYEAFTVILSHAEDDEIGPYNLLKLPASWKMQNLLDDRDKQHIGAQACIDAYKCWLFYDNRLLNPSHDTSFMQLENTATLVTRTLFEDHKHTFNVQMWRNVIIYNFYSGDIGKLKNYPNQAFFPHAENYPDREEGRRIYEVNEEKKAKGTITYLKAFLGGSFPSIEEVNRVIELLSEDNDSQEDADVREATTDQLLPNFLTSVKNSFATLKKYTESVS